MPAGKLASLVAMIAVAVVMLRTPSLAGDRISDLTTMLASSSEKTRLSAAVSLARLADKRTMKPLVGALKDANPQVRAVAATALGKLAHQAAYPALKNAATGDTDATVRQAAHEAAIAVAKANNIKDELTDPPAVAAKTTSGFGHSPHAVEDKPDLFVTVKGTNDDSPGNKDKASRKANAEILKTVLSDELKAAPAVTTTATDAQRWGLDQRTIDVSIVKMETAQSNGMMEVATELRLAVSDQKGRLLSFLSGGAKVQIPLAKYQAKFLPNMKRDAIVGAMKGMMDKLLAHLRQIATT